MALRAPGCGSWSLSGPSGTEGHGDGGRRVLVGPKGELPAPSEAGEVSRQGQVVLAGDVDQHVQAGEPGRELPGVGAGVVDAVRQQQDAPVETGETGQLSPGAIEGEGNVGEALGGDTRQELDEPSRGDGRAEVDHPHGVGPEGHDSVEVDVVGAALVALALEVGAASVLSVVDAGCSGAQRPNQLRRFGLASSPLHWQRSEGGTWASTCSTWAPQPFQVGRLHLGHVTALHIP
jgi:hypothetical protein